MPRSVAISVPAVRAYQYMVVNGEAVLVDPTTTEAVAELSRGAAGRKVMLFDLFARKWKPGLAIVWTPACALPTSKCGAN